MKWASRASVVLLMVGLLVWSVVPTALPTAAAPIVTVDDAGPDDEPGQKDLNFQTVDFANLAAGNIAVTWGWDDTVWPGQNTGDACALFDTDADPFANFSLCVTVGVLGQFQSIRLYTCTDLRIDRCSQPTEDTTFASTGTASVQAGADPFGAAGRANNDCDADINCLTADTVASVTVQLADVGANLARLLNVCTYPSREPNSDPNDCVTTPGVPTPTATATNTPTATSTNTPTATATNTPTATATNTPTATATNTPTATPTDTPTATPTDTPTATPTDTPTATPTDTPTATPTDTPTATPTDTPTATPTDTPTATPTDTPTATPTDTPTATPTDTPTATNTPTNTPTPTPVPQTGKIAPTNTTCQDFRAGTASDLNALFYNVQRNQINSVAPGVLFYYNAITAPSSSFTIQVTQSNTLNWPAMGTQQLILWDANCVKTQVTGTVSNGTVTFNATGLTAGATYIISVKYSPSTLVGQSVSTPLPTNVYTFTTSINGSVVPGSSDSLNVAPKL